jgi:hypothetical protein
METRLETSLNWRVNIMADFKNKCIKALKILGNKKLMSSFTLLLIFWPVLSHCEPDQQALPNLSFKRVVLHGGSAFKGDYEQGKYLYHDYSLMGLPENFLIKKTPDISFNPSEIEWVEITKMPFVQPGILAYDIKIVFDESAKEKIRKYTSRNVNKRIALEIDEKILAIATIVEPVATEMVISVSDKTVDELEKEFSKVSEKISIIGNEGARP